MILIYLILLLLIIVAICGCLRVVVEYRFRKKLLDDPTLMENNQNKKKGNIKILIDEVAIKMPNREKHNPFLF